MLAYTENICENNDTTYPMTGAWDSLVITRLYNNSVQCTIVQLQVYP